MVQDAINNLSEIQKKYNTTYSIEVFVDGSVYLHYMEDVESDEVLHQEFNNSQDLLEWMETNLNNK